MIRLSFERKDDVGRPPETRVFDRDIVVVGREATISDAEREVAWVLPYADVSRLQCRFTCTGGVVCIEGLSERSGTFVNGRRIVGVTRLAAGDVVRFGNCKLGVLAEMSARAQPGPAPGQRPTVSPQRPVEVVPFPREVVAAVKASMPVEVVAEVPVPEDMSPVVAMAQRWHELGRRTSDLLRDPGLLQRGGSWLSGGAPLGGSSALVRAYVESSLHARRANWQRAALITGWLGLGLLGGAVTAQVMAKDLDLELPPHREEVRQVCQADALVQSDTAAQEAEAVLDDTARLLLAARAVELADDGSCLAESHAEQLLRRRLAGRSSRRLGAHESEVVVVAAQGERAATVDAGGTVRVWDLEAKHAAEELEQAAVTVTWSREGRWLATGAAGGAVHLYTAQAWPPRLHKALAGHADKITALAIDPQNRLLASGDERGVLRLWSLSGEQTGASLGEATSPTGAIEQIAFDSKSSRLYVLAGEQVRIWSLTKQRLSDLYVLPTEQVTAMAVNARGDRILTGNRTGLLFLWQPAGRGFTAKHVRKQFDSRIAAVAFVPNTDGALAVTDGKDMVYFDLERPQVGKEQFHGLTFQPLAEPPRHLIVEGQLALTVGNDGAPEVWDLAHKQEKPLFRLAEQQAIRALAVGDSSRLVTGGRDGTVRAWPLFGEDWSAGARTLLRSRVRDIAIDPGGELLASASADGVVRVWQIDREGLATRLGEPVGSVTQLAISADRRWVAGVGEGGVLVWDVTAAPLRGPKLAPHESACCVAWSRVGATMVTGGLDGNVIEWRVEGAQLAAGSEPRRVGGAVEKLAMSTDQVAVGVQTGDDARALLIWPLGEASTVAPQEIARETSPTRSVVFDASGERLAAAYTDGRVRTWRVAGSVEETGMNSNAGRVMALGFAVTGELAIGNENGEVIVMRPEDRRAPQRRVAHKGPVSGVAFGATANIVISTGSDGKMVLWRDDLKNPRSLELSGHTGAITHLRVDAEGKFAVTASDDGTVRQWPLQARGLLRFVCDTVGRDLSADEWGRYLPGTKIRTLCPTRGAE